MKKRILCIVLSLSILACMAVVKGSFAWISFVDEVKTHMLDIGQLKYDVVGELNSNYHNALGKALIVPGQNLIVVPVLEETTTGDEEEQTTGGPSFTFEGSPLMLKNYSTIDSQVRIKIEYTYYNSSSDPTASSAVYQGASSEKLQVNFPTGLTYSYNSSDGYWYCSISDGVIPAINSEDSTGTTDETTTSVLSEYEEVVLIEDMYYKGDMHDKTYEGKEVSVTITLQAKQAYYVDWEDITQLNL